MERPVFVCPHVCVIVPDIMEAFDFYQRLLGVESVRCIAHYRDERLFQAAGFAEYPGTGEAAVCFLSVPGAGLTFRLLEYDPPEGQSEPITLHAEGINGTRQVTVAVENIERAFAYIQAQPDVLLINHALESRTYLITRTEPEELRHLSTAAGPSRDTIRILSGVKHFYFIDKYGLQWNFTQGHSEALD